MSQIELTLFIAGNFVDVKASVDGLECLHAACVRILQRKLNRAVRAGVRDGLQALAESAAKALKPEDLQDGSDEVEDEALAIAEADVTARLAKEGLPPPRSIREHAQQLVNANASYMDRARARLKARADVVRETLSVNEAEL